MGLFSRRKRKIEFSVIKLAGGAHCAVHGESFCGPAIDATLNVCRTEDDEDRVFDAFLIPEPDNKFDENAVGVWSTVGRVGYIPRDDAVEYRPLFDEVRRRGFDGGGCVALMRGGTPEKPNIGIVLRLSRPEICLAKLP